MDSTCSFHMTPGRLWFQEFTELERDLILFSDNKSYKIIGVKTIKFHLHDGTERVL